MNMGVRVQLSVMMFIQFFVWGTWYVAMGVYLPTIGFTGTQIGFAYSSTGWAAIVSPFIVGMIADRFFPAQIMLGMLHLLGGALLFLASQTTEPTLFFVFLLGHTLCYMPTLALTNTISFNQMKDPAAEFPAIRVMGTLAWIAAGIFISRLGVDSTAWPMKIGAICSVVMGVYSLTLPSTTPKAAGKKISVRDVLGLDALALFRDRSFAVFMIGSLLICIPLSFYYGFAASYLTAGGIKNITATMTLGQMSEFFFMLVIPFFFARLGVKKMLLVGMGAWVLRYMLFAFGENMALEAPLTADAVLGGLVLVGMWYLGILLHGVCYDFFFVTGQIYTDMRAPKELQSSAQGLFALMTWGVGMTIGTIASGKVKDFFSSGEGDAAVINWFGLWMVPTALAFAVFVIFLLFFRETAVKEGEKA